MAVSVKEADALFDDKDAQSFKELETNIDRGIRSFYDSDRGNVQFSLPHKPNSRVERRLTELYKACGWKQVRFETVSGGDPREDEHITRVFLSKWEASSGNYTDR